MDVSLDSLLNGLEVWDRSVMRILLSTLQYEADADLLATKLADDIKFICQAEDIKFRSSKNESDQQIDGALGFIWAHLIDIACITPSDHPRQDCLAKAINLLHHTEGVAPGMGNQLWSELPEISLVVRERWNDGRWVADEETSSKETLTKEAIEEFESWKNQNSFIARITTEAYCPSLYYPFWELREGLEEPAVQGPVQEVRIWVACEWILRCAKIIYNEVQTPCDTDANAMSTGELCGEDIPERGLGRWAYWKKRLEELSSDAEKLKLDDSIVERMAEAMKTMDAVSGKHEVAAS